MLKNVKKIIADVKRKEDPVWLEHKAFTDQEREILFGAYTRNTHIDQFDVVSALFCLLPHQCKIIVFIWYYAKSETISDSEDTNRTRRFTCAELDVFEASGI